MNVLFVLAHPERASFNGALVDTGAEAMRAAGLWRLDERWDAKAGTGCQSGGDSSSAGVDKLAALVAMATDW